MYSRKRVLFTYCSRTVDILLTYCWHTVHVRFRSLPQGRINTHMNAVIHQPLVKRLGVLRYHNTRRQRLSSNGDIRDYRYVFHISWYAMMYRLTVDHLRNDHFLVLPIFPFQYADFVEIKINSVFISWTYSCKQHIVSSIKTCGNFDLESPWSVLLVSIKLSRWCKMKESTNLRLTEREYFALE
jgi:hypothetical protein